MTMLKKRYKVYATFTTLCHAYVTALDEEDAIDVASNLDPDNFNVDDYTDLQTTAVELYSVREEDV